MLRTGINDIRQAQLSYAVQTLHIGMLQHVINEFVGYGYEPEYRIVDDLAFVRHRLLIADI